MTVSGSVLILSRERTITGFSVEAIDGSIGKIDEATNDVDPELRHR